jgi:hypothetical protein
LGHTGDRRKDHHSVKNVGPSLAWKCSGSSYLLGGDRLLAGLLQLSNGLLVVSQILLAADKDNGQTLAEVKNLRDPL